MYRVIFLLMIPIIFMGCLKSKPNHSTDQYWSSFRQAVMNDNKKEIIKMTQFPFEIRGGNDGDPVKYYDKKRFLLIYEKLLNQKEISYLNGKEISKSMKQLIIDNKKLIPKKHINIDSIGFYQFRFKLIKDKWFFTRSYLEEK